MSDIESTIKDGPSSVSVTADAETEARRQRMRNIVAKLTDYMVTYSAQPGYEDYSDTTLIDDVLYGLGIALEPEKHHAAQGYDIFRQKLMLHLRQESTPNDDACDSSSSGFDCGPALGALAHIWQNSHQEILKQREAALRQAITKKLGRDDWIYEDLIGRMHKETLSHNQERYILDGEVIVHFGSDMDAYEKAVLGIRE